MTTAALTPRQMAQAALEHEQAAPLPSRTPAGVQVPLQVSARDHGMAALVDGRGNVMGLCVSSAVAEETRNFLR